MRLEHPSGDVLDATLYPGQGRGQVVLAGATATPQAFYRRFAEWLSDAAGVDVITFDYRGVGRSRHGSLKGLDLGYREWAADLALAIGAASARGPVAVVGHSFGGHAFGMTSAHADTLGLYTFGTGTGWSGFMAPEEARRVWLMWNLLAPPLVASHGYLPFSKLGMGEDLPRGVYRDWKRWCRGRDYFFDDDQAEFTEEFDRVNVPVVGVASTDDAWAPPSSLAAFMSHYPRATLRTVRPALLGLEAVGHMGYFRPEAQELWADVARWVESLLTEPRSSAA